MLLRDNGKYPRGRRVRHERAKLVVLRANFFMQLVTLNFLFSSKLYHFFCFYFDLSLFIITFANTFINSFAKLRHCFELSKRCLKL